MNYRIIIYKIYTLYIYCIAYITNVILYSIHLYIHIQGDCNSWGHRVRHDSATEQYTGRPSSFMLRK